MQGKANKRGIEASNVLTMGEVLIPVEVMCWRISM